MFYKKIMLSIAALSLLIPGKMHATEPSTDNIQANKPLLSDRTKTLLASFGKGLAHGATNNLNNHAIDYLAGQAKDKVTSQDKDTATIQNIKIAVDHTANNCKAILSGLSFMAYRETETVHKKMTLLDYTMLMGIGHGMQHVVKNVNTMQNEYANMIIATGIAATTTRYLNMSLQGVTKHDEQELLAHGIGQLIGESVKIEKSDNGLKAKPSLNLNLTLTIGIISTLYRYCFPTK